MQSLIAVAVIGGATMCSIGIALLLECLLLKVILGLVAKATRDEEARAEPAPEQSYRDLRRPTSRTSLLVSHLG